MNSNNLPNDQVLGDRKALQKSMLTDKEMEKQGLYDKSNDRSLVNLRQYPRQHLEEAQTEKAAEKDAGPLNPSAHASKASIRSASQNAYPRDINSNYYNAMLQAMSKDL